MKHTYSSCITSNSKDILILNLESLLLILKHRNTSAFAASYVNKLIDTIDQLSHFMLSCLFPFTEPHTNFLLKSDRKSEENIHIAHATIQVGRQKKE